MAFADFVLALSFVALSIGLGWLVYMARIERERADAMPALGPDPVDEFRALQEQTLTIARKASRSMQNALATVKAGVK